MQEFEKIILGNANLPQFAASLFYALLTAAALILFRVSKRDPKSERTPEELSWRFFWSDNFKRNIGTLILIFLTIRISQFWVKPGWTIYAAVIIGLISDQLAMLALKLKDKATEMLSRKIDTVQTTSDAIKKTVDEIKENQEQKP